MREEAWQTARPKLFRSDARNAKSVALAAWAVPTCHRGPRETGRRTLGFAGRFPYVKMSDVTQLKTERLILRAWRSSDLEPLARINADPRVMEFLPSTLSRTESDALAERTAAHFGEHGFGLYAAELRNDARGDAFANGGVDGGAFIGWIGLSVPRFEAHFTPCVEIGWRLAADSWGRGLATEGAREVVRHAFGKLALDEIVSFTVAANVRSTRVMQKLGMTHDPADDFDHPALPPGHPLRRHVLYRLGRATEK